MDLFEEICWIVLGIIWMFLFNFLVIWGITGSETILMTIIVPVIMTIIEVIVMFVIEWEKLKGSENNK